jgi:hypothetical protein
VNPCIVVRRKSSLVLSFTLAWSASEELDGFGTARSALQAELARLEVEKNCLKGSVAEHRADFERERDRCDKLMAETLVLTKVAMSARENAARLEGEVSARRGRRLWAWLVAPRRASGQRRVETPVTASGPSPHRIVSVPARI